MTAVLIFPPFCLDIPTYMPMGIAGLKSYVESRTSHKVKCLDFNQIFFKKTIFDDKWDVCGYCRGIKSKCDNFGEKKCAIKYRTLAHNLFIRLKNENGDYEDKCAMRKALSDLYHPFSIHCLNNMKNSARRRNNTGMKKIFDFYIGAVTAEAPDITGFSIFSSYQKPFARIMAEKLKKIGGKKIVFGGHIIGLMTDKEKKSFLKKNPFVDFLVEKEGEEALLKLLDGAPLKNIPNLFYREKGSVKKTFKAGTQDVNRLPPPDYTDFKINEYILPLPVLSLSTSRTCVWNRCTFCSTSQVFNEGFRQKDTAVVVRDIKALIDKHQFNTFFFADPCISAVYVKKLIAEIKAAGLDIRYGLMMRCERELKDEKFAAELYESGCRYIVFGVETLTKRLSKLINKGIDVDNVEEILLNCRKNNIYCHIAMIFGLPTQTFEDMKKEAVMLKRICDKTGFHTEINILHIEKGTVLAKNFKDYKDVTIGEGNLASESDRLLEFIGKTTADINKDKPLRQVSFDDIFLTSVNSCERKDYQRND